MPKAEEKSLSQGLLADDASRPASPERLRSEVHHAGSAQVSFVVSTLTGQKYSVRATGTDSIVAIKRHILQQAGIPIAAQRILRAGVELEDTQTLADCGVVDKESTLMRRDWPRMGM